MLPLAVPPGVIGGSQIYDLSAHGASGRRAELTSLMKGSGSKDEEAVAFAHPLLDLTDLGTGASTKRWRIFLGSFQ
jgi:hypothetical protein